MSTIELTFGKHQGKPLADVPSDYLEWLRGQGIRNPDLKRAVEAELQHRSEGGERLTASPAQPDRDSLEAAVEKLQEAVLILRGVLARRGGQ